MMSKTKLGIWLSWNAFSTWSLRSAVRFLLILVIVVSQVCRSEDEHNSVVSNNLVRLFLPSAVDVDCVGVIISKDQILTAPVCAKVVTSQLESGSEVQLFSDKFQNIGNITEGINIEHGVLRISFNEVGEFSLFPVIKAKGVEIDENQQLNSYYFNGLEVEQVSVNLKSQKSLNDKISWIASNSTLSYGSPVVDSNDNIICLVNTNNCMIYYERMTKNIDNDLCSTARSNCLGVNLSVFALNVAALSALTVINIILMQSTKNLIRSNSGGFYDKKISQKLSLRVNAIFNIGFTSTVLALMAGATPMLINKNYNQCKLNDECTEVGQ